MGAQRVARPDPYPQEARATAIRRPGRRRVAAAAARGAAAPHTARSAPRRGSTGAGTASRPAPGANAEPVNSWHRRARQSRIGESRPSISNATLRRDGFLAPFRLPCEDEPRPTMAGPALDPGCAGGASSIRAGCQDAAGKRHFLHGPGRSPDRRPTKARSSQSVPVITAATASPACRQGRGLRDPCNVTRRSGRLSMNLRRLGSDQRM
jgi:hypothetical protein